VDIKYELNKKRVKIIPNKINKVLTILGTEYLFNFLTKGKNIINKKSAVKKGKIIPLPHFKPTIIIIRYANVENVFFCSVTIVIFPT
jgi:hypothetical protein